MPNSVEDGYAYLPYVRDVSRNAHDYSNYADYLNMLLADLTEAENLLAEYDPILTYSNAELNVNSLLGGYDRLDYNYRQHHMNYYGVCALRARVALWMGDVQNAITYARTVINATNEDGTKKFTLGVSDDVTTAGSEDNNNNSLPTEHVFGTYVEDFNWDELFASNTQGEHLYMSASKLTDIYSYNSNDWRAEKWYVPFEDYVTTVKFRHRINFWLPFIRLSEMYLIAFMAALKCKKNVVFYGNLDFFTYLKMIIEYGISFEAMAGERIKVSYSTDLDALKSLDNRYVVIGTYNEIPDVFGLSEKSSFAIITAATYFNPLKGQLNAHNVKFVTVEDYPELQGYGHAFWGDVEKLNTILKQKPMFIPTHCPVYMIDDVRALADFCRVKLIGHTPKNNQIYKLQKHGAKLVSDFPAKWLVVLYHSLDYASFVEVWQKRTSGLGLLKRTISRKRCQKRFKAFLIKRKRRTYEQN